MKEQLENHKKLWLGIIEHINVNGIKQLESYLSVYSIADEIKYVVYKELFGNPVTECFLCDIYRTLGTGIETPDCPIRSKPGQESLGICPLWRQFAVCVSNGDKEGALSYAQKILDMNNL